MKVDCCDAATFYFLTFSILIIIHIHIPTYSKRILSIRYSILLVRYLLAANYQTTTVITHLVETKRAHQRKSERLICPFLTHSSVVIRIRSHKLCVYLQQQQVCCYM